MRLAAGSVEMMVAGCGAQSSRMMVASFSDQMADKMAATRLYSCALGCFIYL